MCARVHAGMTGVTTSLSVLSLSDEGKAQLTDPHSLRDYQHSQAAAGLRGGGGGGGGVWGRRKELGGGHELRQ